MKKFKKDEASADNSAAEPIAKKKMSILSRFRKPSSGDINPMGTAGNNIRGGC